MSENNIQSSNEAKVCVVIPALNEEKGIGMVIDKLHDALKKYNYEIVVVDKSTDRTAEIALQHGAKVIYQTKKGYGSALFAGYLYSIEELQSDILITIDGDGTYEPNDCPKIIEKILSHDADFVVGKRVVTSESMTRGRRLGNKAVSYLIRNLLKVEISDTQSGLFAFRSYLIKNIDFFTTLGWALNTELQTRAVELGMNIEEIEVSYYSRVGESKLNIFKAGVINLTIILRMVRDSQPLMLMGVIGSVLLSLGTIFGGIVVYDYLQTGVVHRGNLAVLSAMLVITGVQIFSLGLVADMIKRRQQKRAHFAHNYYSKIKRNS
jgi:dolichol-phosphate mannosyltransferase